MKTIKKYWYKFEVWSCVLCGSETVYKHRVYTKPTREEKYKYHEKACDCHFI